MGSDIGIGITVSLAVAYFTWAIRENVLKWRNERKIWKALDAYEAGEVDLAHVKAIQAGCGRRVDPFGAGLHVSLMEEVEQTNEARRAVDEAVRTGKGIDRARVGLRRALVMWDEERQGHYMRLAIAEAKAAGGETHGA